MWQKREHMMKGVKAAHASPNTPKHLKPHLKKRMSGKMDPDGSAEQLEQEQFQAPPTATFNPLRRKF